jgi:hypothetical protein
MTPQRAVAAALVPAVLLAAGWTELPSLPQAGGCRCVKCGAWLAYDSVTGYVFAAKGNKTCDFVAYDPVADTWLRKTDIPYGDEMKPVSAGGAGCAAGNGAIFASKGNNTVGFHAYHATANAWQQLPDVPLGTEGKKCKCGTDVAFVPGGDAGGVYLLKGRVRDFFRYDVQAAQWQAQADAPIGNMYKWDKGSWLAYDGAGTIYAHKAKIHELHRFDVTTRVWHTSVLVGMPHFSPMTGKSKKSRDGASAVFLDGLLYAFKGGNTQEFWQFDPAEMKWTELETLPRLGSSGKRRKVKSGADLCTDGRCIYALKGAKTNEFWRYEPHGDAAGQPPRGGGVKSEVEQPAAANELVIAPNPARGAVTVRRVGSARPCPSRLYVYDAGGRLVWSVRTGSRADIVFDAGRIPSGLYFIRLTGPGYTAAGRLVVE